MFNPKQEPQVLLPAIPTNVLYLVYMGFLCGLWIKWPMDQMGNWELRVVFKEDFWKPILQKLDLLRRTCRKGRLWCFVNSFASLLGVNTSYWRFPLKVLREGEYCRHRICFRRAKTPFKMNRANSRMSCHIQTFKTASYNPSLSSLLF